MARFLGKSSCSILVYPRAIIEVEHGFQPNNGISYRALNQGAVELTLPRVQSIQINKEYASDAATCEITVLDPNNELHPLGNDEDWGNISYPALVPNTLIKTYQGYDTSLEKTGTWLIDEVVFNNPPDLITIRCRDLGKLLLEQTLYPPIIPDTYYPIGFCTQNDKQQNEIYKNTDRWIAYNDLSEVVKCVFRIAGLDSWNVESTGVMITLEEMSQMMLIDIITRVKEIVGYSLYFDVDGIPHFQHAPISGSVIPNSQYMITEGIHINNVSRRLIDTYARSKLLVYGKTLGGVGNINIIPPQDIQHVDYQNRQITHNYCFGNKSKQSGGVYHWHNDDDWNNFKSWVAGMSAGESDSWDNISWIPTERRGSGANYYGMKCYNAVKNFQIQEGLIRSFITNTSAPVWGDEIIGKSGNYYKVKRWSYGGRSPSDRWVGNFFTLAARNRWNQIHSRVPTSWVEHVPGRTEIDYDELKIVNASFEPNHFLTPMRGQIRIATHSDEALENEGQCAEMARLIDFWSNIHNNTISLTVYGENRYDVGHIVDIFENGTKINTKALITGLSSTMNLENGSWEITLDTFDLEPPEPVGNVEPGTPIS